jgi:hypothetical protein
MHQDACVTDSTSLRQQLTAADPMQRAIGLHALEIEVERCTCTGRGGLTQEVARFAARGIPYYSLQDPHFKEWVGKAVAYWEKLQAMRPAAAVMAKGQAGASHAAA